MFSITWIFTYSIVLVAHVIILYLLYSGVGTAMSSAVLRGNEEVVEYLINSGADIDGKSEHAMPLVCKSI